MKTSACKQIGILIITLLLLLAPAQADFGTLFMVVNCEYAPLYAAPYAESNVLGYVRAGEIVYCIEALADQYCVGYGNSLGYIENQYLAAVNDDYYAFTLPGNVVQGGNNQYVEYRGTPYFTYPAVQAKAVQKLATRSGPGTKYTDTLTYPQSTQISAYYTVNGADASWTCIEFIYRSEKYRLYTGAKRVGTDAVLPVQQPEETFSATVAQQLTPYYGPGYDYALAKYAVPAGSAVQGVYQTADGWLMFDYTLENGKLQRAWAPPSYWQ